MQEEMSLSPLHTLFIVKHLLTYHPELSPNRISLLFLPMFIHAVTVMPVLLRRNQWNVRRGFRREIARPWIPLASTTRL